MANRERGHAYASLLIPADDKWNPLEHVTAAEYIPPAWIGAHAGLRLVEAFKTLAQVPASRGPASKSGWWPHYKTEWVDLLAREEADAQVKEDIARSINRVRIAPSAQAVSRMEAALSWPGRYLVARPLVLRVVQSVARFRSIGYETDKIAHRLHKSPPVLRRINRNGLDAIAAGLRRDDVAVF